MELKDLSYQLGYHSNGEDLIQIIFIVCFALNVGNYQGLI